MSKVSLREKERATREKAKERLKAERFGKIVEMNWAIAPGDLEMKLKKVNAFLEEGRKVDIVIAPKKRRRVATKEEMDDLVKKILESVQMVEGVIQAAPTEGKLGGTMTYFFEKKQKP